MQTVNNWASSISPGAANESGQSLNFIVSNNNNSLFTPGGQPAISSTGALTFTPAAGMSGLATVTVHLHDNGGTANGGQDTSASQTFEIAVTQAGGNLPPVNQIPFAPQTTLENQALTFSSGNGNAISVSDADAGGNVIQVTLAVVGGTATLSTTNNLTPVSGGNGTANMSYQGTIADLNTALAGLVYTPSPNISGTAGGQITIATDDLGHTGNDGPKTSTDTININITPVNQPPSFTAGGNVTVPASGSPYNAPWATAISPGPANESGQSVAFLVSNNRPDLFLVQPSISPTGVLTFTPNYGPAGTATITVQLQDNGGTANGGSDTSSQQTFLIQLSAVDRPPVNTVPGGQRLIENLPLVFSTAEYNPVSVGDPDATSGTIEQVQLTAAHGTVTLSTLAGLTVIAGRERIKYDYGAGYDCPERRQRPGR